MKRLYTLTMLALVAMLPAAAQQLFTTSFETESDFKAWKVFDVNADGSTWQFSADNDPGSRCYYNYNGSNNGNDWLISPAISPTADGNVLIRYHFKGSSYGEAFKVFSGNAQTVEAMTNQLADHPIVHNDEYSNYVILPVKAGVPFYLGFYCYSTADRFRLYLRDVIVESADNLVDLSLTEIVTPCTGWGLTNKEEVSVKIKNTGMETVTTFPVTISVNGKEALSETVSKTLNAGEEFKYIFKGTLDLSTPRALYEVTATVSHPDDIETANNTKTVQVRHRAPATVPYSTGFEPDEDNSAIKTFNLNNDSGDWSVEVGSFWINLARTGYGYLGYNYDKEHAADDWVILEPINVEPGYYVVRFWYSGDDNHNERFAMYWGNEQLPDKMTNKVVEYNPFARGAYEESINIVHFDKAQTVCFGFYAFSDPDENWITIDDFSVERIDDPNSVDICAEKFIAPASAYIPTISYKDVTVSARNVGIVEKSVVANLYIDDIMAATQQVTFAAQQAKDITFKDAIASLAKGKHTLKCELVCDGDTKPENNVLTLEVKALGDPDIFYDFEDGKIPQGFAFHNEGDNSLAPGAIEEFGETGWAVQSFYQEHALLGKNFLGASTFMTSGAADRYCILPRVKVESEDACFVWTSGVMSATFAESYDIKASDSSDPLYIGWYDRLTSIALSQESRFNDGVSLGKYFGKDIYIAIRLTSAKGDAVMFDNLSIFGCSASAGIADVTVDNDSNAPIEYYNINGVRVNNDNLAPGIYIRRQGSKTTKVAIR